MHKGLAGEYIVKTRVIQYPDNNILAIVMSDIYIQEQIIGGTNKPSESSATTIVYDIIIRLKIARQKISKAVG